jgi:hypothetical protein
MITDLYSRTAKPRAQGTTTTQDTPQDLERMKMAIAARGIITKNKYSNAETYEKKVPRKHPYW